MIVARLPNSETREGVGLRKETIRIFGTKVSRHRTDACRHALTLGRMLIGTEKGSVAKIGGSQR